MIYDYWGNNKRPLYVNGNIGSNANSGEDPRHPLLTIQQASTIFDESKHSVILVITEHKPQDDELRKLYEKAYTE